MKQLSAKMSPTKAVTLKHAATNKTSNFGEPWKRVLKIFRTFIEANRTPKPTKNIKVAYHLFPQWSAIVQGKTNRASDVCLSNTFNEVLNTLHSRGMLVTFALTVVQEFLQRQWWQKEQSNIG